ncbi:MAG: glutamate 5-kinase [Gemmatimonadota bacterium]
MLRKSLRDARRIVVKAGTRTILDESQRPDLPVLERLLREMVALRQEGKGVIFVSSGAIGTGLAPLGLARRPDSIPALQAAAAVGQSLLMETYNRILSSSGYSVAQLLLTHDDFQDRRRYLNVRGVLAELEAKRVLPVINENDSVAVDEIRFGDNDILAGLVANATDAEVTVLLSDVEGFYMNGELMREVSEMTPQVESAAKGPARLGSGGMASKIRCARIVTAAGGCLLLGHGKKTTLAEVLERKAGTLFRPAGTRLDHRKRWIAHTLRTSGQITIDPGGADALVRKGKSLLAVGITACDGTFGVGDAILVCGPSGKGIAKGLVNYPSTDLTRIIGRRTEEIPNILGYRSFDEIIHRDNMVLLT